MPIIRTRLKRLLPDCFSVVVGWSSYTTPALLRLETASAVAVSGLRVFPLEPRTRARRRRAAVVDPTASGANKALVRGAAGKPGSNYQYTAMHTLKYRTKIMAI